MGTIRERPTVSGKYTKEDLTRYAEWRKNRALNNMTRIEKDVEEGKAPDACEHEEYREPLAVSGKEIREITIELSTGGDADGFKYIYEKYDGAWDLKKAVYYWADWGVYEEVELTEEEAEKAAGFYGVSACRFKA